MPSGGSTHAEQTARHAYNRHARRTTASREWRFAYRNPATGSRQRSIVCARRTIRVKQRLKPIGVAMAGRDVFDPYKD
jgi:hypothetical protein